MICRVFDLSVAPGCLTLLLPCKAASSVLNRYRQGAKRAVHVENPEGTSGAVRPRDGLPKHGVS